MAIRKVVLLVTTCVIASVLALSGALGLVDYFFEDIDRLFGSPQAGWRYRSPGWLLLSSIAEVLIAGLAVIVSIRAFKTANSRSEWVAWLLVLLVGLYAVGQIFGR
jgi:nitric oxide reductase large subunit